MNHRVVVTGLGIVSPIGIGVENFWKNIQNGTCGISKIESFDTSNFKVKVAGEIKDYDPTETINKKDAKRMDRFTHFAITASKLAVEDASLEIAEHNAEKVGIYLGNGIGGLITIEETAAKMMEKEIGRAHV